MSQSAVSRRIAGLSYRMLSILPCHVVQRKILIRCRRLRRTSTRFVSRYLLMFTWCSWGRNKLRTWLLNASLRLAQVTKVRYNNQHIQSIARNQKDHLEVNAIPAGCNAKFCATWLELITVSIVTISSIWLKLCGRLFTCWKISTEKFATLVAPPTDGTTKRLLCCKVHLVL